MAVNKAPKPLKSLTNVLPLACPLKKRVRAQRRHTLFMHICPRGSRISPITSFAFPPLDWGDLIDWSNVRGTVEFHPSAYPGVWSPLD